MSWFLRTSGFWIALPFALATGVAAASLQRVKLPFLSLSNSLWIGVPVETLGAIVIPILLAVIRERLSRVSLVTAARFMNPRVSIVLFAVVAAAGSAYAFMRIAMGGEFREMGFIWAMLGFIGVSELVLLYTSRSVAVLSAPVYVVIAAAFGRPPGSVIQSWAWPVQMTLSADAKIIICALAGAGLVAHLAANRRGRRRS